MAQSVRITLPKIDAKFSNPNQVVVAVEMYRPVRRELIPNMTMVLKGTETGWPETNGSSGNTPSTRTFSLGRELSMTGSGPLAYFPMDDQDLWGSMWSIQAHLLVADPTWSSPIFFTVEQENPTQPYNLEAPQILLPRHNRTYSIDEEIPTKISFQPEADLHLEFSYRAAGTGDFIYFREKVVTAEELLNHGTPGFYEVNGLGGLAFLTNGVEKTDIQVKAWISMKDTSQPGLSSVVRSDSSQVVTSVLISKLIITAPVENKQFISPAQVILSIPFTYKGLDFDMEKFIEMEVEFKGHESTQPVPSFFQPYADASYTASRIGIAVLVNYSLKDVGFYRFRARFSFPSEASSLPAFTTAWTDWRQIEVTGLINQPGEKDISAFINHSKKLDISQYKSPTTSKNLQKTQLSTQQLQAQKLKVQSRTELHKQKIGRLDTPVFLQPQELQKLRHGVVHLKVKGLKKEKQLDWQMEYKQFGTPRYRKSAINPSRLKVEKGEITGIFQTTREGEYRIRVRSKAKDSRWSPWRMFQVGSPTNTSLTAQPQTPTPQLSKEAQGTHTKPQLLTPKYVKPEKKPTMNKTLKPILNN